MKSITILLALVACVYVLDRDLMIKGQKVQAPNIFNELVDAFALR